MDNNTELSLLAGGDVQFDSVARPERKVCTILEDSPGNGFMKALDGLKIKCYDFATNHPRVFRTLSSRLGDRFERTHFRFMNNSFSCKTGQRFQLPLNTTKNIELWHKLNPNNEVITAITNNYNFENEEVKVLFPFLGVRQLISQSDISFSNLECPISDRGKIRGMFRADPIYAKSIKHSGIDIVSVANNHAFDAGEEGFLETLTNLERCEVLYVGGGKNLESARAPRIIKAKGISVAFLGYTDITDNGFYDDMAGEETAGILPFYPPLILEDIKTARDQCDILVLSLHWGIANNPYVHNKAVEYAHKFIDAGVDIVLGHHSHVSKGIEIYKGKPIFYSFGNFIFGIYYNKWHDNFLAKICLKGNKIDKIHIYPVSGKESELFQPVVLNGIRASNVIKHLERISSPFGTKIHLVEHHGIINIGDY